MRHFAKLYLLATVLAAATAFSQTTVTYKPSNAIFPNPERGFFSSLPREGGPSESPPNSRAKTDSLTLAAMKKIRAEGQSVVGLGYNLAKFRDRKISKEELQRIKHDFELIREGGMKCQLRFAYSESIGEPDAPLNIILEHIAQLKPILIANCDVIAVMQAGFIGAWGEWHSSTNGLDNTADRRKILFAELNALPKVRMIQVRTPYYVWGIFNRTTPITRAEAFNGSNYSRVGQHNDCFLANRNDYGTYVDTTRGENYIAKDCLYVPMGGETCHVSKYCERGNALCQMNRLHWSLLNSSWNPALCQIWEKEGCLDEVKRRLGYRFELLSGTYDTSLSPGSPFHYTIRLTNLGFASLFNPRDVEIILQGNSEGDRYVTSLPIDPRFWQPGDTVDVSGEIGIPSKMPTGKYSLYLNIPDPAPRLHFRPAYSIRLANKGVWKSSTGYNSLNATVDIVGGHASRVYKGRPVFRKLTINSGF